MVNKFDARGPRGNLLTLSLDDPSSGLIVKDIEGLDPVKATIVTSTFAMLEGAQYQSSRREARDIVLTLGLDPRYGGGSVRAIRDRLYSVFMPKSEVNLRFYTAEGLIVHITGRVESFSAPFFVQEPEAKISVFCFNSDFQKLAPDTYNGATAQTLDGNQTTIAYAGTVETGVTYRLLVNRSIAGVDILHTPEDGITRVMEIDTDLIAGDVLEVVTIPGEKRIRRIRPGQSQVSVLADVSPKAAWTLFQPGNNKVQLLTPGSSIAFTVAATARFGGL